MKLIDLYGEAMKCAEEKNSTNTIRCIRMHLEKDINNDADKYLKYLLICKANCDIGQFTFVVAVITFVATTLGIVSNSVKSDSVWIYLICIIYLIIVLLYSILALWNYNKYRTMLEILEHMDFK